jgi:hypothetical protein
MATSEQILKIFDCPSGIANDAAHGDGIDRIVAGNRDEVRSVRHDDVFALTNNAEARLLERFDGFRMINAGELRHA